MDIDNVLGYMDFVPERHRVWELRQHGWAQGSEGWTKDPILASRKFTNVFRILDPGTQYVLGLMETAPSAESALMRAFLYRHTGRVEAWDYLDMVNGGLPDGPDDLAAVQDVWAAYRGEGVVKARNRTGPSPSGAGGGEFKTTYSRSVFTNAYLVFPQSQVPGTDKQASIVDLTHRLFDPGSEDYIWPSFVAERTQQGRFKLLRAQRGVGDFMAMQVLTDIGYSTWLPGDENAFVQPGPGAKKGLASLGLPQSGDAIARVRSLLLDQPACPRLALPDGRLRAPSLMDVQNTLCEWSKYVRLRDSGKPAGKPYQPAHPGEQPEPSLPDHW